MAYTPTVWKNGEAPAINAENLNKMEQGIADANTVASNAQEAAQEAVAAANSVKLKTSIVAYVDKTYTAGEGFSVYADLENAIGYAIIIIGGGNDYVAISGYIPYESSNICLFGVTKDSTPYQPDHVLAYAECYTYVNALRPSLEVRNIKKFVNGSWVDCAGSFKVRIVKYYQ